MPGRCGKSAEAAAGLRKRYSTDANLAGLSNEAEDLESLETPATIVTPTMGVWPHDAPDKIETVSLQFEQGVCVELNGKALGPLDMLMEANQIAGRSGIGIANALENRIIGTKSRGVYEAPGMELLGSGLEAIYQAVLDRRSSALFRHLSQLVSDQIYDGRLFDPAPRAALAAIDADVVGLIEIENHPADVPTADLVSGLNAMVGPGTYDYIATGAVGPDAIRVAFIYKPATVSLIGDFAVQYNSISSLQDLSLIGLIIQN